MKKTFLIRDDAAFKLRGKMTLCPNPNNLWCIEFTGEEYNDKGEIGKSSTYQFFLEPEHIKKMAEGLLA
jgi:hypothetical protein